MSSGSVFPRFASPPGSSVLILGLLISLGGCEAQRSVPGSGPPQVALAGSDQVLWLIRQDAAPDESAIVQLYFRPADRSTFGRFVDLPIPPISGRPAKAVARGPFLHVFFQGGTHRRYAPVEPALNRSPSQAQFIELSLPEGQTPAALAADAELDRLYALVPQPIAAALRRDTDEPPSPIEPNSPWAVVRYEDARWVRDRAAPADISPSADVPLMLASNEVVHLVYRTSPRLRTWTHRYAEGPAGDWQDGALPDMAGSSPAGGGWVDGEAVVLWVHPAPDGLAVRSLRFMTDSWVDGPTAVQPGGRASAADRPAAVAMFGDGIAVATPTHTGAVQVNCWSTENGQPAGPQGQIVAPTARTQPGADSLLQYAVLSGILAVLFIWRRDTLTRPAPLHEGLVFAQLSKRAAALLIDLAILLPVWGPILFVLWRQDAPSLTVAQQLTLSSRAAAPSLLWSKAVVGAVVGLYAAILESWSGRTAGKRVVGLSVAEACGGRCTLVAIVVRNLARVIEFHFPPLLLLVAFTPSRQRLGDLLAKTVVVEPAAATPTNKPDSECADENPPGD